jgi:hypothetical protein
MIDRHGTVRTSTPSTTPAPTSLRERLVTNATHVWRWVAGTCYRCGQRPRVVQAPAGDRTHVARAAREGWCVTCAKFVTHAENYQRLSAWTQRPDPDVITVRGPR